MSQPAQQQSPPGRTADSGIGKAVAIAFAREGADVLIAGELMLASDEAGYVSGARVAVTGGRPILQTEDVRSGRGRVLRRRAVASGNREEEPWGAGDWSSGWER